MFDSTHRRSVKLPVYGEPGVDSSMKRPYSGWYVGTDFLVERVKVSDGAGKVG